MRMTHFALLSAALLATSAFARLPAPSEEAKAKAAETAARTAWTGKLAAFQLCKAQNQAVTDHQATMNKAGKSVQPSDAAMPACTDPGAFATPVATRPIEAAGAHSPPATATKPPSTTTPDAVAHPTPKN